MRGGSLSSVGVEKGRYNNPTDRPPYTLITRLVQCGAYSGWLAGGEAIIVIAAKKGTRAALLYTQIARLSARRY